jgi:CPA1 family monovalent cation:H+ antiporter
LAPARDEGEDEQRRADQDAATTMDIMRQVIEMLTAQQNAENSAETQAVIRSYNDRLSRIKANNGIEDEPNVALRLKALGWEYDRAMELMERGVVSGVVAYRYMGRLEQVMGLLEHGRGRGRLRRWNGRFRALWHRGLRAVLRELPGNTALAERTEDMRWLQTATRTYAIEHLEEAVASSQVPTEDAATLLVEYQRSVAALHSARPSVTSVIKVDDLADGIKRRAYAFELEQIQDAYEDDRLSRAHAQRMRESVQLMQMDLEDTV